VKSEWRYSWDINGKRNVIEQNNDFLPKKEANDVGLSNFRTYSSL